MMFRAVAHITNQLVLLASFWASIRAECSSHLTARDLEDGDSKEVRAGISISILESVRTRAVPLSRPSRVYDLW